LEELGGVDEMRCLIIAVLFLCGCCQIGVLGPSFDAKNETDVPLIYSLVIVVKNISSPAGVPFEIKYVGHWAILSMCHYGKNISIEVLNENLFFPLSQSDSYACHKLENQLFCGYFIVPGVCLNEFQAPLCVLREKPGSELPEARSLLDAEYEVPAIVPYCYKDGGMCEILIDLVVWPHSRVSLTIKGDCELKNIAVATFDDKAFQGRRRREKRGVKTPREGETILP
jgi:hypothetical protein